MALPTFEIECLQNDVIANGVHEIRFTKPADFAYQAGQFVMIEVPLIDDPSDLQMRAYSIASSPEEKDLLFVIKLKEGGRASRFVAEKLEPGTKMKMQGPLGIFTLDGAEAEDGHLLVCTSSGVAPFRSMIQDVLQKNGNDKIDLVFGVRSEEDLFWVDEFNDMADGNDNITVHFALSRPDADWNGLKGRVQQPIGELFDDLSGKNVYICGNPAMVDDVKKLCLEDWNVPKDQLHMEEYL